MVEEWGAFVEVHVAASVEECAKRDVKGLYERRSPERSRASRAWTTRMRRHANPELVIDTEAHSPEESAQLVVAKLEELGLVQAAVAS